jgi:hypothetical protein
VRTKRVGWCRPSRRASATVVCRRAIRAWVRRHRAEGTCRVRRSGPIRRAACRCRRPGSSWAISRWRGLGIHLTGREHRQRRDTQIRSRPRGSLRVISTENDTHQRPARCDTVAERIRAAPRSTCRASVRVDSSVRIVPIRGSRTCRRSRSTNPNTPVVNRHDRVYRIDIAPVEHT